MFVLRDDSRTDSGAPYTGSRMQLKSTKRKHESSSRRMVAAVVVLLVLLPAEMPGFVLLTEVVAVVPIELRVRQLWVVIVCIHHHRQCRRDKWTSGTGQCTAMLGVTKVRKVEWGQVRIKCEEMPGRERERCFFVLVG